MSEDKRVMRIPMRPYTTKELIQIYGNISRNTFRKWLEPIQELLGTRRGYYYSIPQVKIIFSVLQLPSCVMVVDETEESLYSKAAKR